MAHWVPGKSGSLQIDSRIINILIKTMPNLSEPAFLPNYMYLSQFNANDV